MAPFEHTIQVSENYCPYLRGRQLLILMVFAHVTYSLRVKGMLYF
jgi:hypothetical protein